MMRTWAGRLAPIRSSGIFCSALEIHSCTQKYNISRSGHLPEFHQAFKYCARHKSNTPTSPNCTCHEKQHCIVTKCCPCYQKWHSSITQMLRLARTVTLQHQQILCLSRVRCEWCEWWVVGDVVDVWCERCEWRVSYPDESYSTVSYSTLSYPTLSYPTLTKLPEVACSEVFYSELPELPCSELLYSELLYCELHWLLWF